MRGIVHFVSQYGTIVALLALCVAISVLTFREQPLEGDAGAMQVAGRVIQEHAAPGRVLVVVRATAEDGGFADRVRQELTASGLEVTTVQGDPVEARQALARLAESKAAVTGNDGQAPPLRAIVANFASARWPVLADVGRAFPTLGSVPVYQPKPYRWPTFLKYGNLLNVANQIAVIAILAVGMTFVIVAGGIDLSVGSLIALSSVVAARLVRDYGGGADASNATLFLDSLAGITLCGLLGLLSGALIIGMQIPPFIVTLSMMMVASGAAFLLANGNSIPELPARFTSLGRGMLHFGDARLGWGIPYAVLLTLAIYLVAHLALSRTVWGRHVYAVGDNPRAAWLSGIPVSRVVLSTYVLSGLLAGLGGIVVGSTYQSGDPRYGAMYELYVIAAVVVGGTSLSGGRGTVFGTLVGALISGVINNGMNLMQINPYVQKIILGLVILGAVALDRFKKR